MLIAIDVIFTRPLAINTSLMKIGLGFTAEVLSAMLFGPWWAAITAAMADLLGSLIFPTGAYFPGFTVTAAITGIIFGLMLYKRETSWNNSIFTAFLNCFIVSLAANTLMISFVFGAPFKPLLVTRLIQFAVMLPVQAIVIRLLGSSKAVEVIRKTALS